MGIKGVFTITKKDGSTSYRASMTCRRRHISLGSYPSEEEAHRAYVEGTALFRDASITLGSYSEDSPLSFHRWVSIANFRDNGIYIANPIYLHSKYFDYYLSPEVVLKFDRDDLFYYSSHRIMQRGGRLFVSDFGVQSGILQRYGIMPYAVAGRDYRFVNGDDTDFRYENIQVDNIYHGVERHKRDGRICYKSRIHIKSNIIIGYYDDEITAAIAYNKAIDAISDETSRRSYLKNYIPGLPAHEYETIYDSVVLPDHFDSSSRNHPVSD